VVALAIKDYEDIIAFGNNMNTETHILYQRERSEFKKRWNYLNPSELKVLGQKTFATADSLSDADLWIQAIDEYSRFLDSDWTDYALFMIGMCKDAIATAPATEYYRRKYGNRPHEKNEILDYIQGHQNEFRPFLPEGIYISQGVEFKKILAEYPNSEFVDDSAYMLLLQSLHNDWEGHVPILAREIDRCKEFLQRYPMSEYTDEAVALIVWGYELIITQGDDLTSADRLGFVRDLDTFKKKWYYIEPNSGTAQVKGAFTVADSLYKAEKWVQAISEYTRYIDSGWTDAAEEWGQATRDYKPLLDNGRADYALYMIGMCKDAMATFTLSDDHFYQWGQGRSKYTNNLQDYYDCRNYIKERPDEFRYFDPGALYISQGAEFKRLLSMYPKSGYVDDSAYTLLQQSRHHDWEGSVPPAVVSIERCKAYLKQYPTSEYTDEVVAFCVWDYEYIIHNGDDLSPADSLGFVRELDTFKKQWNYVEPEKKSNPGQSSSAATDIPQTSENRNNYLLSKGRAGNLELGMNSGELYSLFDKALTRMTDLKLEGYYCPAVEIYADKSMKQPSIVVQITDETDWKTWRIRVHDIRYKTKENIGIGSTLGEIKKAYGDTYTLDWTAHREGERCIAVPALKLHFELDFNPYDWKRENYDLLPADTKVLSVVVF
jgi:outer membrane protein assembly factor BamD (BamD/ComL family)